MSLSEPHMKLPRVCFLLSVLDPIPLSSWGASSCSFSLNLFREIIGKQIGRASILETMELAVLLIRNIL